MTLFRRTFIAAAGTLALAAGAFAADYPSKPVEYIIPFGPGGESDITARLQQPFFKEKFGQDLVVSYKPGGGGAVGWAEINRLTGDGYAIMGVNLPHIVLQPAQKDVGYKTDELDVAYWFHYTPDAIVVKADSPYKSGIRSAPCKGALPTTAGTAAGRPCRLRSWGSFASLGCSGHRARTGLLSCPFLGGIPR